MWIGHLLMHHVEASVRVLQAEVLEPISAAVLRALRVFGPATSSGLDRPLGLGTSFVQRLLAGLAADSLADQVSPDTWRITPKGEETVQSGFGVRTVDQRRVFHFLHAHCQQAGNFLPLAQCHGVPCPMSGTWTFSASLLRECIEQSSEWKRQHQFPEDVQALLAFGEGNPENQHWHHVILDSAERISVGLALIHPPHTDPQWWAYALDPVRWTRTHNDPVFKLDTVTTSETFGDLFHGPEDHAWDMAWRTWCETFGISAERAAAFEVVQRDTTFQVQVPQQTLEYLRCLGLEAIDRQRWLLVGGGLLRRAVNLELVSQPP